MQLIKQTPIGIEKMKRIAAVIVGAAIVSGCATPKPQVNRPSVDQLILTGEKIVWLMTEDRPFLDRSYRQAKVSAKTRGEALPVVTVENLKSDCPSELGITDYALTPVREGLKVALRKTDMFVIKDNKWSGTVDYGMSGELISSDDGTRFFLRLRILDYNNDQKEVWNEFQKVGSE